MFPYIHRFDFYLPFSTLLLISHACFQGLAALKRIQSIERSHQLRNVKYHRSLLEGTPRISMKDQTITISRTPRRDFCCSRLATGLAVRQNSLFRN